MATMSTLEPSQREILVNLGDRYAVFGASAGLPQSLHFRPDSASDVLSREFGEADVLEARIAETLRVYGMKRAAATTDIVDADVELLDDDGNHVLIDIKVRERDPKQRDIEQGHQRLVEAARMGQTLEIWYFNIERLKLIVMHLDRSHLRIDELTPLDVWEKTPEGVFDRARVLEEVEDWISRVLALYKNVQAWLSDRPDVRCEQTRSVTMSEELMQKFAVTDRDIPVLDVLEADQVIASFVPRGLWLIGSWGRIDVITRDLTQVLVALGGPAKLEWKLVSPGAKQRTMPFDKNALLALVTKS
jgi:hypothetical protein